MSSDDDDGISWESASEASDNDRSARFSRNTDDDHSQSQYKKKRRETLKMKKRRETLKKIIVDS
jgi:hypothetical protein